MTKAFFTLLLLLASVPGFSQPILQHDRTRQTADSLIKVIPQEKKEVTAIYAIMELSEFYIWKSLASKSDLDSAGKLIENAKQINTALHSRLVSGFIQFEEAAFYMIKGQNDTAKLLCEKSVNILSTENNPDLLGEAYINLCNFYAYEPGPIMAVKIGIVEKALGCFERSGNLERQGLSLETLCICNYQQNRDFAKAVKLGQLSIQKYNAAHAPNLASIYITLADIYHDQNISTTSLTYCLKALTNLEKTGDTSVVLCYINSFISTVYDELNIEDSSRVYAIKALTTAEKLKSIAWINNVGPDVVKGYNDSNRPFEALRLMKRLLTSYGRPKDENTWALYMSHYVNSYRMLNQFDKAQPYCDSILRYAALPGTLLHYRMCMYGEAMKFYLSSHQYDKGRMIVSKYKSAIAKYYRPKLTTEAYNLVFQLDTAQHLYDKAVEDILQRDIVKDTIYSQAKAKEIEQIRIEYETSEKERSIESLQKEAQLQNKVIDQSTQVRDYAIAGAVLLFGLLAVTFNRYRLKQRNNRQLQVKQMEISNKNAQLEKLLHENEWLLKEVHHRVKNNLQVVMSLLNSQSSYLKDAEAVNAVTQSKNRVQAMSLIHQKLYKTENVSTINMPDYIRELVDYLRDAGRPGLYIVFHIDIASVELDVMEAVPVGLILNEAITNSCKYAFPEGHKNTITVKLNRVGENELTLYISDNGVGLPTDYDKKLGNSFGMLLIRGMVEDLSGKMKIENDNGVGYTISFPFVAPSARMLKIG
jgi:two-component system, sensor histidine kinase PdtaS